MKKRNNYGIAMKFYRVERWLYIHHFTIFAKIIYRIMQIILGCTIPYTVDLGKNVTISHFHGIVIHHESKVGEGTYLYQHVTLGGRNGQRGPYIGKNCIIGAGACILGNIKIGDNVNVGANAVVLHDVPNNCTIVGVPAKIVKLNGEPIEVEK